MSTQAFTFNHNPQSILADGASNDQIRDAVSDILTITGGGLQYDSQAFDLAPAALRGQVLEAMRQAVTA